MITPYQPGEKWRVADRSLEADLREVSSSSTTEAERDDQALNTTKACVFHRGSKMWTLSFDGTTAHVAELVGINYIAELLRHPRTPIDADTLVATIRENTDAPVETVEERVVRAGAAMPGIPLTDAKAVRTVKAEWQKRSENSKTLQPVT